MDNTMEKLILLERKYPTTYEVHLGEISQTKNLILTTPDKDIAERLVNGFNSYYDNNELNNDLARGIKTELRARMIIRQPNDKYKEGFNDAMRWAINLIERYERGEGLFQIS